MTDLEQWMKDHKGRYLYTAGYIWECGDDDCMCEQATIIAYYENKVDSRWRVPVTEWSGKFFADHTPGAEMELANYRHALSLLDPKRESEIIWQVGVDYDKREV